MPHRRNIVLLLALWALIFFASLFAQPVLDDADATHAQAAQAMLHTHNFVTLHVDGVRYLEKAPLPYWIAAASMAVFGENTFAMHFPIALAVLALAMLGYRWARRAFGADAAFLTAMFTLTCVGTFLFTRIFIPDALLAFFLALSLYAFLRTLDPSNSHEARSAYIFWIALALAVLTKGLVAIVFIGGTVLLFAIATRSHAVRTGRQSSGSNPQTDGPSTPGLRLSFTRLRPFTGLALFLLVAAPWHILAGLRNTGGADGHGFFWFYFINEHVLRFLGRRIPRDYNKLPALWYWTLHLVWLFPWALFVPAAIASMVSKRALRSKNHNSRVERSSHPERSSHLERSEGSLYSAPATTAFEGQHNFRRATIVLLILFSSLVLVFFSLSTNQEYYTFPVYLPLLMLLAAALSSTREHRWLTASFAAFAVIGAAISITLGVGLYASRALPFNPDIGSALAHRSIGAYTLSMSHLFDLTGASFAALRLPATLALAAFAIGPIAALVLWRKTRALHPALLTIALTMTVFFVAAHIALTRFAPMLSSKHFADRILALERERAMEPDTEIAIFGDQAFGSSLPFYLHRPVLLVDGRSTSMLFGSTFPDVPPIFLTHAQLLASWGSGPRKLLFVPAEQRAAVQNLLGQRAITVDEQSEKLLLTDRPLSLTKAARP
jgi:4-amino-4-deoxy-L-arabinose transferase-like glycosyltransferase